VSPGTATPGTWATERTEHGLSIPTAHRDGARADGFNGRRIDISDGWLGDRLGRA